LWLSNALRTGVKSKVLLNGVDDIDFPDVLDERLKLLPEKKSIILFVGKLERYKGCYEFIESLILLSENKINKVHALVIGTGSEQDQLKKIVEETNHVNNFTFIERLPHGQISAAHKISDIYVSMNHLGNLSNANIEAIQSDDCMVIPNPQPEIGVDVVTNKLLLGAVVNVPINDPKNLADALYTLLQSKEKRSRMSKDICIRKQNFLWSWDERINAEISLLEDLVTLSEIR
jgi:glycosyltransferase involved in cell wall biosynthesis